MTYWEREIDMDKKRIIAYLLSALLLIGYVGILWWARTPAVSDLYRMYYIDHSLSVWPGDSGLKCQLGVWEYMGNDPKSEQAALRLGAGWYDVETGGRWTKETEASIWYYDVPEVEGDFLFHYVISSWITPGDVDIYANGNYIGILPETTGTEMSIIIPSDFIAEDRILKLTFCIDQPVRPSDSGNRADRRELGVMFDTIMLDEGKEK